MFESRAVSNTLGFVLLFGVVFFSIVAVNTLGIGALGEARDTTISQNAALSMESLSDTITDLREENTTSRLSVVRGGSGTLGPGEETQVTIHVDGIQVYQEATEPIVYSVDDSRIVYEAGALIRTQNGGGAIAIDRPDYLVRDTAIILPVVRTESVDGSSVSSRTITTYLEHTSSAVKSNQNDFSGSVQYRIETTAQRAPVWEAMLEEMESGDQCGISGGDTVDCTFNPSGSSPTVIVRDVRIVFELVS